KRAHLDDLTVRFVLITAALFAGAVLATQYPTGGTWEWGWRYFAIAVGLVVPVAISALDELVSVYPAPARRRLVLTGVAGMVGLVGLMLSALRITHVAHAMMVDDVVTQIAAVEPSDGGTPVMVTTVTQIGRLAWQERPDDRWLLVDEDELFEAVDAVRASSVGRFAVLVDAELGTALLARGITVEDEVELWGGYAFLVVAG
ncbi:MAG: hypothetical protein GY713_19745, partial [Actinomycetia bacterium]|nr:hypothetical protein [Actinomycetes bacterium]